MKKRSWISAIIASMLLMSSIPAGVGMAESMPSADVQFVSDQQMVIQGGTVGYHLLYHNVQNKNVSKAWVKVKLSEGLEIDVAEGAEWDATTRTLKWNFKEIETNHTEVRHFNLKVKADVSIGAVLEAIYSVGIEDIELEKKPPIRVVVGTSIDQPVFNGYPDGLFHPERQLTRAETAAIVARIKNLTATTDTNPYKDVPADHWAAEYIKKVTASGYMNGFEGSFRPDEPISRAEFIVLMLRVRGIRPFPIEPFLDSKKHWANQEIGTAQALKYIDGWGDGLFIPDGNLRRDESAKLLNIMLLRGELKDGDITIIQHWPDVPKQHWSFGWVEELSLVAHESRSDAPFSERLIRYLPDQTEPF